jgi:hypothetical protein
MLRKTGQFSATFKAPSHQQGEVGAAHVFLVWPKTPFQRPTPHPFAPLVRHAFHFIK